jgi:dethiobiotin synthetase
MTRFVVTGTDTDVGKTVFAAGLVAAIGATYWKPVQSGLTPPTDTDIVRRLSGCSCERVLPEAYRLTTPASPHVAAEIDGVSIDPARLALPGADLAPSLVVEGAGGVLVPLTRKLLQADLFAQWDLPVILVASTRLGTINHSLLSLEALKRRTVQIHGIAFVGEPNDDSESTICDVAKVRRLGRLPHLSPLTPQSLRQAFDANFVREDFL